RLLQSIARTYGVRCAGSRSQACSCAPATAASITPTARALPDLPSAACFSTATRSTVTSFSSKQGRCQRPPAPPSSNQGTRDAPDHQHWQLVRSAAPARQVDPGDTQSFGPAGNPQLVLRFW